MIWFWNYLKSLSAYRIPSPKQKKKKKDIRHNKFNKVTVIETGTCEINNLILV